MPGSREPQRGAVLLEAMVALALLGIVGGTAAWSASEMSRAVASAHAAEEDNRSASELMTAVTLWPRADLDRHLGRTRQRGWYLAVDRRGIHLYRVAIVDTATGSVLARTSIYRPAP